MKVFLERIRYELATPPIDLGQQRRVMIEDASAIEMLLTTGLEPDEADQLRGLLSDIGNDGVWELSHRDVINTLVEHILWGQVWVLRSQELPGSVAATPRKSNETSSRSSTVERTSSEYVRREAAPREETEREDLCELKQVSYTCSHGSRGYTITLPMADGSAPKPFEVIAGPPGSGGDTITPKVVMSKPYCDTHNSRQLRIVSAGHVNEVQAADQAFEVNTFRPHGRPRLKLLANLWPWNVSPVTYRVNADACDGTRGTGLVIHAYPDVTVSASVALMLNPKHIEERSNDRTEAARDKGHYEKRGRPAHTEWKLQVGGKIKYGTEMLELGVAFKDKIKKIASINRLVKRAIDNLSSIIYKWFGIALMPELPNLAIEYEGKFQELKGDRRVDNEWNVLFKANPLIGITIKLYVIKAFINALKKAPGPLALAGQALGKIHKWAEDAGNEVEIWLALTGLISGEAGAEKLAGSDKITPRGAVQGKLRVELGGSASVKGSLIISFEAGVEAKAHSALVAELSLAADSRGAYVVGKLFMEACKFEWATWITAKTYWDVTEKSATGFDILWKQQDFLESSKYYVVSEEG